MPNDDGPSHYASYLLRVWRAGEEEGCRALLENVATGERVGFDDLAGLLAFLEAQIPIDPQGLETFRVCNGENYLMLGFTVAISPIEGSVSDRW